MFKMYVSEILGVPPELHCPMTQVYYLPSATNVSRRSEISAFQQVDSLNVSAVLENSDMESVVQSMLLATFALTTDREWLLKLFFKKRDVLFKGRLVRIFPDLARETQRRRREFLLLRPSTLQLGTLFFS